MTTSKELVSQAIHREEVDRVPFCPPFQGFWALANAGVKTIDSINNPEMAAKVQFEAIDATAMDSVQVLWDWLFPIEAMGCKVKIPEFGTIGTVSHVINSTEDAENLEIPDFRKFYRCASAFKSADILIDRYGKDHYTIAAIPGPFTIAGELRGVETLLYDCMMDPESVEVVMKKALEIGKVLLEMYSELDVDAINVGDPTTSGDMMCPEDFDRFSKKNLIEYGKIIKGSGKDFIIHMCGDTNDRLDRIADTGCDAFSGDTMVDMPKAIEKVGDRIALIGNLNPSGLVYRGTPDEVREASLSLIKSCGKKGYLLGAGCEVPIGTSIDNLKAMYQATTMY